MSFPNLITKHNTYICITKDYIHPSFFQGHFKVKKDKPPTEKGSIKKRNSRIIQIGHACKWETFLTLTFSPEFYWDDLQKIQKQFRAFIKSLYYELDSFKYLAVLEYGGQTGRIHYHMLTNIPFNNWIFSYRDHPVKKVCDLWDFGFSDVVSVNNENCNAVFYLCKYLTKDTKNRTPIGKREVFSSKGLNIISRNIVYGNITGVKGYHQYAVSPNKRTVIYVKDKA